MPGLRARHARSTRPLRRRLLVLLLTLSTVAAAAPPATSGALPELPGLAVEPVAAAVEGPVVVEPVEAPVSIVPGKANRFVVRVANAQDEPIRLRYDVVQLAEPSQGWADGPAPLSWAPVGLYTASGSVAGGAVHVTFVSTSASAAAPPLWFRSNVSVQPALSLDGPVLTRVREARSAVAGLSLEPGEAWDSTPEVVVGAPVVRTATAFPAEGSAERAVAARTTFELGPEDSWLVAFDVALVEPLPAGRDLRLGLRLHLPGAAAQIAPLREVPIEAAPGPTAPVEAMPLFPVPFLALCATTTSTCLPLRRRGEGRPPGLRDGDGGGGTEERGPAHGERWLFLPFLGLYTRLGKSELLQQATRDRVYRRLVEQPGTHLAALRRETGLATGVLLHHLRMLERHQFVVSRREGDRRCYYPTGTKLPEAVDGSLSTPEQRVLQALAEGWISQRELADRLGMSQQGASYHLVKLRRRGLVAADRSSGLWKYRAVAG